AADAAGPALLPERPGRNDDHGVVAAQPGARAVARAIWACPVGSASRRRGGLRRPARGLDHRGHDVDAGSWVRCIDVKAGKVVVRPVEKPELTTLENADFG